ncbi:hypothetical protein ACWGCW_16890, partial [Streptomyces sp. NPDC054933]
MGRFTDESDPPAACGGRRPNLELLLPLARAYGVPLDELVGAPHTGDPRVHLRPVRRFGMTFVPLTRRAGGMQAHKLVIPPRAGDVDPDLKVHEGYEWLYVLAGRLGAAMHKGAIDREAVLKTLDEYDRMAREAFLSAYGYGEARSYLLVHEGKEYDSKAVAGVAHQHLHGRALRPEEFSGGRDHAVRWLKDLGFHVKSVRNPDWARDELILACDLVTKNDWRGLDAGDPRVVELSQLLQLMPVHTHPLSSSGVRAGMPYGVVVNDRGTAAIAA